MKTRLKTKDIKFLLLSCAIIAIMPLTNLALKPRPLRATSTKELLDVTRRNRQDKFVEYWEQHLKGDYEFVPPWTTIKNLLREVGASETEIVEVSKVIWGELHKDYHYPVLAERGYVRGQPVWLVAGSNYQPMTICHWGLRSNKQDYEDEVVRCCSDMKVIAVSAKPPYRLMQ